MTNEELRNVIRSSGVKLVDVAEKLGINAQTLQGRLRSRTVRREYTEEIIQALKDLTGGDVCIQTNENGDNHFKSLVDASSYMAKVAELEERVKALQLLNEEKEKRIADKDKQLADKEKLINVLMERK